MASTYSDRLGFELQANGENPNSWGDILNNNVISLIDEAIAGYAVVSVSSVAVTLTDNDGSTDQSRNAALEFDGTLTAAVTVQVPSEEKVYFIRNSTTGSFALNMKTAAGSAIEIEQGKNVMVACDGTNMYQTDTVQTSVSAFTANSLTVVSGTSYGDSATATFGAGNDLTITHDGSNSKITDSGTGDLQIAGSKISLLNAAGTETMAVFTENSASELYYDNSVKLATVTSGVSVTGDLVASGDITAFSAAAAKTDIETIPNPLDLVNRLRGVSFRWKDRKDGEKTLGFIYEEVADAVPELARDSSKTKSVMYQNTVALLVEAVKELSDKVKELESKK